MGFSLKSAALAEGQPVPMVHTCDGENLSPPLAWSEPPPGTKAFALVVDDPDAPGGLFTHWLVADIAAAVRALEVDEAAGVQGTNDFRKTGWGGPCPPRGHGPHHYRFRLHALGRTLRLRRGFSRADLDSALRGAVLATATLTTRYERRE